MRCILVFRAEAVIVVYGALWYSISKPNVMNRESCISVLCNGDFDVELPVHMKTAEADSSCNAIDHAILYGWLCVSLIDGRFPLKTTMSATTTINNTISRLKWNEFASTGYKFGNSLQWWVKCSLYLLFSLSLFLSFSFLLPSCVVFFSGSTFPIPRTTVNPTCLSFSITCYFSPLLFFLSFVVCFLLFAKRSPKSIS